MKLQKQFSIRAKMFALVGFFLLAFCFNEWMNYQTEKESVVLMNEIARVQLPAVQNETLMDMLHDGLRGVVLSSIVGSQTHNEEQLKSAQEDVVEYGTQMRNYLGVLDSLPLDAKMKGLIGDVRPDVEAYTKEAQDIVSVVVAKGADAGIAEFGKFDQAFGKLEVSLGALGNAVEKNSEEKATSAMREDGKGEQRSLTIFGVVFVISVFLGTILTRSIVGPMSKVMKSLTDVSEQLSLSTVQIASHGQTLAQGATEQAASLQETAATLEEISSMSEQNANNSKMATTMSVQVQQVSDSGGSAMTRMKEAIESIKRSSDETAAIIKTIDEIAFQTNLLALNAAVEAARAGDAGKGFAVVAEEVRSLAQRSSNAAKDTAERIRVSRDLADNGVKVSNEVSQLFQEIRETSVKAADIVREISAGSQEQSTGMSQINVAVAELDKVTQVNAASAEEFAATGEELLQESKEMKNAMQQLNKVVYGKTNEDGVLENTSRGKKGKSAKTGEPTVAGGKLDMTDKASAGHSASHGKSRTAKSEAKAPTASQIIPLDESDLPGF